MKVEEQFSDCQIPHTLYLLASASGLGHGKFHSQAMPVQDPTRAQPSIDANRRLTFTMRGTPLGMDAWKTSQISGALKCKTERGPIRSWRQISCRFHQDSRVCLLRFNCSVSGPRSRRRSFWPSYCLPFPVTLESFRSSLITRSRSGWRFLALEKCFFRIQLCNPRYLVSRSLCLLDSSQCCPLYCSEHTLSEVLVFTRISSDRAQRSVGF